MRGWGQCSGNGDGVGEDGVGTGAMAVRMGRRWE